MATHTNEHGHEAGFCAFCAQEVSTHSGFSLAFCGDCGKTTCPDHRVDDSAERCVACAALFYAEPVAVVAPVARKRSRKSTRWTVEWFDVSEDRILTDTFGTHKVAKQFWSLLRGRADATNLDLYRGEAR